MVVLSLELGLFLVFLVVIYLAYLALYRLYLSPIASFPGPKLAALTLWYEFYYDVICRGQYEFKIAKLHAEYGPIVRINPYEIHVNDPEYHDTLYPGSSGSSGSGKKVEKWPWVMKQFGTAQSSFGTASHTLHRARRAAVAPLFSKRAITALEPFIQEYVDELVRRLAALKGTTSVVNLIDAFSCLTGDIISDYAFGRPSGFLQSPDFAPHWHKLMVEYGELGHLCKQFGWVLPLMQSLPTKIAEFMNPPLAEVTKLIALIHRQIDAVDQQRKSGSADSADSYETKSGPRHKTVFHHILESELPESEKSVARLEEEGSLLMSAGTATTADTLAAILFHVLENQAIQQRMREELGSAMQPLNLTRKLKLQELEQLPYLTAVIKEGLRTGHGIVQRNSRIHPETDLVFHEWVIPRGTPVSMSTWMTHTDATVFLDPMTYKPERWLSEDAKTQRLDKYLVSFGKGSRQCAGLRLAYAEMYLTLAALFTPSKGGEPGSSGGMRLTLFETTEDDILMARDCFVPGTKDGSKGVRVIVE